MQELLSKLQMFSGQAKRFKEHEQFFKNLSFKVNYIAGQDTVTTLSGINEETFISVLVHFRNFYMSSSKIYFSEIAEAILKEADLKDYWEKTREFLSAWETLLDPDFKALGGLSLQMNEDKLSAKKNFDIWLNENYFHIDQQNPGSKKGLDGIKSQHVFENVSRFSMVDLLQRLCGLIMAFDIQVVEKILHTSK